MQCYFCKRDLGRAYETLDNPKWDIVKCLNCTSWISTNQYLARLSGVYSIYTKSTDILEAVEVHFYLGSKGHIFRYDFLQEIGHLYDLAMAEKVINITHMPDIEIKNFLCKMKFYLLFS